MSRARAFAFTWNNYDEAVVVGRFECLKEKIKYYVYGHEIGESGTPHLQGTVVFKNPMTLKAAIGKLPGCHVSICRDVDASVEYCKKDGLFIEYGEYVSRATNAVAQSRAVAEKNAVLCRGNLSELSDQGFFPFNQLAVLKKCQMIYQANLPPYDHDDVRGEWYWGEPGTGKSRTAREENPDAYIKAQNKWFDGYVGQDVIILDDLDSETLGHYIKIWTDRYNFTGETKNGHVQLQHKKFIITSNYSPEDLFKDAVMAQAIRRRCRVLHFNKPL